MAPKLKPILVKICGITNAEDARWAANFGADFVGINFCAESPRKVSFDKAQEIAENLPSFIKLVGVVADPDAASIEKIVRRVPLHFLQLHGEESGASAAEIKTRFGLSVWKAVRVRDEASLEQIQSYVGVVDRVLLDAHRPGQLGGTGETFDWGLAAKAKDFGIPLFLAGGLKAENVRQAIQECDPAGVDVASGVEKDGHPRKKDLDKMKAFIAIAKTL